MDSGDQTEVSLLGSKYFYMLSQEEIMLVPLYVLCMCVCVYATSINIYFSFNSFTSLTAVCEPHLVQESVRHLGTIHFSSEHCFIRLTDHSGVLYHF